MEPLPIIDLLSELPPSLPGAIHFLPGVIVEDKYRIAPVIRQMRRLPSKLCGVGSNPARDVIYKPESILMESSFYLYNPYPIM